MEKNKEKESFSIWILYWLILSFIILLLTLPDCLNFFEKISNNTPVFNIYLLSILCTFFGGFLLTYLIHNLKKLTAIQQRGYIKELCIMVDEQKDFIIGKKVTCFIIKKPPDENNLLDLSNTFKYNEIIIEPKKDRGRTIQLIKVDERK